MSEKKEHHEYDLCIYLHIYFASLTHTCIKQYLEVHDVQSGISKTWNAILYFTIKSVYIEPLLNKLFKINYSNEKLNTRNYKCVQVILNSNKMTKTVWLRNLPRRHSVTKFLNSLEERKNADTKWFFLFKINNFILVVLKDMDSAT